MLKSADLKAFSVIGREDSSRVAQFPAAFYVRHKGTEGAVCGRDELVVKQATPVHFALLIGFVVRLPLPVGFLFVAALFVIGKEASALGGIPDILLGGGHPLDPPQQHL